MSSAERQAQAQADVERIGHAMYAAFRAQSQAAGDNPLLPAWEELPEDMRSTFRFVTRRLLMNDVVRVGRRPIVTEPTIDGQVSIDDAIRFSELQAALT